MKEFNKEEYNKLCCKFIGTKIVGSTEYYIGYECVVSNEKINLAKYDSDWNWIHMVATKITKLVVGETWEEVNIYARLREALSRSYKDEAVQAIWEFLLWYNENNKEL